MSTDFVVASRSIPVASLANREDLFKKLISLSDSGNKKSAKTTNHGMLWPQVQLHDHGFYYKIVHAMPLGNSSMSNAYNQHYLACPTIPSFHSLP
jgi:hypothetical protein